GKKEQITFPLPVTIMPDGDMVLSLVGFSMHELPIGRINVDTIIYNLNAIVLYHKYRIWSNRFPVALCA
ncbi:hypothetical protein ACJX0J_005755, partial [Zea mays]